MIVSKIILTHYIHYIFWLFCLEGVSQGNTMIAISIARHGPSYCVPSVVTCNDDTLMMVLPIQSLNICGTFAKQYPTVGLNC